MGENKDLDPKEMTDLQLFYEYYGHQVVNSSWLSIYEAYGTKVSPLSDISEVYGTKEYIEAYKKRANGLSRKIKIHCEMLKRDLLPCFSGKSF